MIDRLPSNELEYIGPNQLDLLQESPRSDQPFSRLAIGGNIVIQLHDIARGLDPEEASKLRVVADNLASTLKRLSHL